jgi:hypothetical protein
MVRRGVVLLGPVLTLAAVLACSACGDAAEPTPATPAPATATSAPPYPLPSLAATLSEAGSKRTVSVKLSGPGVKKYERTVSGGLEKHDGAGWTRINTLIMAGGGGYPGEVLPPGSAGPDVAVTGAGPDVFPLPALDAGQEYRVCLGMTAPEPRTDVTACSNTFTG